MLAFAYMVNFFADEFAGLGGRRLAFTGIFSRSIDGFLLGHDGVSPQVSDSWDGWLVLSLHVLRSIANRNFTLGLGGNIA